MQSQSLYSKSIFHEKGFIIVVDGIDPKSVDRYRDTIYSLLKLHYSNEIGTSNTFDIENGLLRTKDVTSIQQIPNEYERLALNEQWISKIKESLYQRIIVSSNVPTKMLRDVYKDKFSNDQPIIMILIPSSEKSLNEVESSLPRERHIRFAEVEGIDQLPEVLYFIFQFIDIATHRTVITFPSLDSIQEQQIKYILGVNAIPSRWLDDQYEPHEGRAFFIEGVMGAVKHWHKLREIAEVDKAKIYYKSEECFKLMGDELIYTANDERTDIRSYYLN